MIVYMILNEATEMSYVGKCIGTLEDRWHTHVDDAEKGSTTRFHTAIREWGADVWTPVVLQRCYTEQELDVAEGNWIAYLDTCDPHVGYNTRQPKNSYDLLVAWLSSGVRPDGVKPKLSEARREFFRQCGLKAKRMPQKTRDQMSPAELERYREYGRKGAERARQKRLGKL